MDLESQRFDLSEGLRPMLNGNGDPLSLEYPSTERAMMARVRLAVIDRSASSLPWTKFLRSED